MKKILSLIVLFIIPVSVFADNDKFTASAPSSVNAGEQFRITYEFNDHPSSFEAPGFEGFRLLMGPQQSTSTSIQIINGQQTRKQTVSYTYILEASEEGNFEIQPAKAVINGSTIYSNTVSISVFEPGDTSPPAADRSMSPDTATESEDELFIKAQVSNKNPYQGEQVIVSYKIYTRVPVRQYSIERLPSYQGFWSENLSDHDQTRQQSTEIIDGHRYQVAEIRRVALFPQRSGSMTLEPLEVECFVRRTTRRQRGDSWFDDFFSSHFDRSHTVRETVRSNAVSIEVKPLPTQNRPSTFKGLVGNFQLSAYIDNKELELNDPTSLIVELSGEGNLKLAETPGINFPANLEVFDPRITENISKRKTGISGTKTLEYLMIPRTEGEFAIPPIEISYFDPGSRQYRTLSSESFKLNVKGGSPVIAGTENAARGEDVKYLTSDIRYIYLHNINLHPADSYFFRSNLFYLFIALPFVLFVIFVFYYHNKMKNKSNQMLMRNKQANKVAKKRLKRAGNLLNQSKEHEFFEEIFKTLWGYISDKYNIPVSELNKENIKEQMTNHNIPVEIIDEFIETLDACEFARFAPGDKEKNMDMVYSKVHDVIVRIEKWVKRV